MPCSMVAGAARRNAKLLFAIGAAAAYAAYRYVRTHARSHPPTHPRTHPPAHALTHARTHSCTHAPTRPRAHAPTRPRTPCLLDEPDGAGNAGGARQTPSPHRPSRRPQVCGLAQLVVVLTRRVGCVGSCLSLSIPPPPLPPSHPPSPSEPQRSCWPTLPPSLPPSDRMRGLARFSRSAPVRAFCLPPPARVRSAEQSSSRPSILLARFICLALSRASACVRRVRACGVAYTHARHRTPTCQRKHTCTHIHTHPRARARTHTHTCKYAGGAAVARRSSGAGIDRCAFLPPFFFVAVYSALPACLFHQCLGQALQCFVFPGCSTEKKT